MSGSDEGQIMRRHDLISSTVLFVVGLFIVFYAPQFGLGSLSVPGPGFMPFLAGLVICGFSIITFLRAFLSQSAEVEKIWASIKFRRLIFVILMIIVYTLLLKKLGFMICTFFLILMLVRYAGSRTWLVSILGGGLSAILSYLLFEMWLKAQLPKGILGF
jgi:putative tricarboxylic transport membrane protein